MKNIDLYVRNTGLYTTHEHLGRTDHPKAFILSEDNVGVERLGIGDQGPKIGK